MGIASSRKTAQCFYVNISVWHWNKVHRRRSLFWQVEFGFGGWWSWVFLFCGFCCFFFFNLSSIKSIVLTCLSFQTLFNPNKTVVKMFVVIYDLREMPANHQTFLRQRTFSVPVRREIKRTVNKENSQQTEERLLRYLIHLRWAPWSLKKKTTTRKQTKKNHPKVNPPKQRKTNNCQNLSHYFFPSQPFSIQTFFSKNKNAFSLIFKLDSRGRRANK